MPAFNWTVGKVQGRRERSGKWGLYVKVGGKWRRIGTGTFSKKRAKGKQWRFAPAKGVSSKLTATDAASWAALIMAVAKLVSELRKVFGK